MENSRTKISNLNEINNLIVLSSKLNEPNNLMPSSNRTTIKVYWPVSTVGKQTTCELHALTALVAENAKTMPTIRESSITNAVSVREQDIELDTADQRQILTQENTAYIVKYTVPILTPNAEKDYYPQNNVRIASEQNELSNYFL